MGLALTFSLFSGMSILQGRVNLPSFEGKVIDAETKVPIEGAAVMAVYHGSTVSFHGSSNIPKDAQETLTDANGEFKIPSKTVHHEKSSGTFRGNLVIFKPGYGVFPDHKRSEAVGVNKTWPPPEKYIVYELPKLKSNQERVSNTVDVEIHRELPFNKQRIMINQVNEEFILLGTKDRWIEKDGKPSLILVR
jgi:hypothetical protein